MDTIQYGSSIEVTSLAIWACLGLMLEGVPFPGRTVQGLRDALCDGMQMEAFGAWFEPSKSHQRWQKLWLQQQQKLKSILHQNKTLRIGK